MTVHYGTYHNIDGRKRELLYRRKIYVPGIASVLIVASVINFMASYHISDLSKPVETTEDIVGVVTSVAGIAFAVFAILLVALTPSNFTRRSIFQEVFIGAKNLPSGFESKFIDHPDYQKALEEHMSGKIIGSLTALNNEIRNDDDFSGRERSNVVEQILQRREIARKSVQEVKSVGGIV